MHDKIPKGAQSGRQQCLSLDAITHIFLAACRHEHVNMFMISDHMYVFKAVCEVAMHREDAKQLTIEMKTVMTVILQIVNTVDSVVALFGLTVFGQPVTTSIAAASMGGAWKFGVACRAWLHAFLLCP